MTPAPQEATMSHDAGEGVGVDRIRACLDAVLQQTQGAGPSTTHVTIPISVMDDVARALEAAARTAPARGDAEALRRPEEDRDALVQAIGFKPGPLGEPSRRNMILKEAAGLRPAMVEARQHARRVEGDAILWQYSVGVGDHDGEPLLLTVWRQRKDAEKRLKEAEARAASAERARDEARAGKVHRTREREKHGIRLAIAWLHARAASMTDPRATQILNSAATNLGWDLAAGRGEIGAAGTAEGE